jgi:hypothetical protein
MLHEVLLALSGHPSPLFTGVSLAGQANVVADFPQLSPSEQALLATIGRLSEIHRKLRRHLESIASRHPSVICRAVAASVEQTHLRRFQNKILEVESKILKKDSTIVGAYEIVPLAAVVGEFDDWHRLMTWYWDLAMFIAPTDATAKNHVKCTSARLIDRLRVETQTGYPEIEDAAVQLARVAETTWLRQLSSWIVYGKLPIHGAKDFFIQQENRDGEEPIFTSNIDLLPSFVNMTTALSIRFIGRSLHQLEHHRIISQTSPSSSLPSVNDSELASSHFQHLSSLSLPIQSSQFSRGISEIRLSLSQNILQHLLPMSKTLQLLACLRQFFLLDRGDFATAIIAEAEERVHVRQQNMGSLLAKDPIKALQVMSIKDAELDQALQQIWRSLIAREDDGEDGILDFARARISLANPKINTSRPATSDSVSVQGPEISPVTFNNLLFPNPTELSLSVASPMDLFLSPRDIATYSAINSYLLAIRRGHQRLSDLWKKTSARRTHPLKSSVTAEARSRDRNRAMAMRKVWATCSAAIFLLAETTAFFEGELIHGSCDHFQRWAESPSAINLASSIASKASQGDKTTQRDPETLAYGHRAFLASVTYSILLTDVPYTKDLRSLLGNIDNLIAFFIRLLDLQQKLDLEIQTHGEHAYTADEEQRIGLELDRARKKVDSDMKSVVRRLRQLDQDRIGSSKYLELKDREGGDFEVWKGGGVDRLLMKLDYGRMVADGRYDTI